MKPHIDNRGAVLLLVLLLLVLLTTIIVQFMFGTRVSARTADSHIALVKNRAAISGATAKAMSLLLQDQAGEEGGKTDSVHDLWAAEAGKLEFDGTEVRLVIEDEQGKININTLAQKGTSSRTKAELERLMGVLGFPETEGDDVVASLADWIDADSDGDFEEETPNQKLFDLSEIGRIPQVTDLVLYGRKPEGDETVEEERGGLIRYVTIWGTGLINLNTTSAEVLASLSETMDIETARTVIEFRKDEGTVFAKVTDLLEVNGVTQQMVSEIRARVCTKSQYFCVLCFAETNGIRSVGITTIMRDSKGCRAVRTTIGSGRLWQLYESDLRDDEEEEVL
jgi:general secretion pathway protein K